MPTLDQLAAATAASDADVLFVSQDGAARKISRAKVIAGLQPQIALDSGTLLGRASAGNGAPEALTVGRNLQLAGGILSATAAPYEISLLPAGTVPAPSDLVPLGQGGVNSAVPYNLFLSGLSTVPNLDASHLLVSPTGSGISHTLADFAASTALTTGITMNGPLTLAADPMQPTDAATKRYVDTASAALLPTVGGALTGPLTLSGNPVAPLHAVTKQYSDAQGAAYLPKGGGTLAGPLVLAADPTAPLQAATKQYADTQLTTALLKSGGTLTGPLNLVGDPSTAMQPATKQYTDAKLSLALPLAGGILVGTLTLAGDPAAPLQSVTKQYADTQLATALSKSGGMLTGPLTLASDPVAPLQAATKQYADAQVATALPKAGGVLSGMLTLAADPFAALHPATKQYTDTEIATALPRSGGLLSGPPTLADNIPLNWNTAGSRQILYDTGTSCLSYRVGGTEVFRVSDSGAVLSASSLSAANGSSLYVVPGIVGLSWDGSTTIRASHPLAAPNITAGYTGIGTAGPITPALSSNTVLSGKYSGQSDINRIVVSSDSADGSAAANGLIDALGIYYNAGGSSLRGGRAAIWAQMNVGNGLAVAQEMIGTSSTVFASTNVSGSFLQAIASNTQLISGAANVGGMYNEFDWTAPAGTSAIGQKGGLLLSLGTGDAVSGTAMDYGLNLANANQAAAGSPGMRHGIAFGNVNTGWPINNLSGTLIGTVTETSFQGLNRNAAFIPMQAAFGVDLRNAYFTGAAFTSSGFIVKGASIQLGNASMVSGAGGLVLDSPGFVGTAVAVATGGSATGTQARYYNGDIVQDAYGGQYLVTNANSSGIVQAGGLSILTAPTIAGAPPSNPLLTSNGSGIGLTLTVTWAAANTLRINPSGDTIIGAGSAISTSATTKFLAIPFCAGAPTAAPANAAQGIALVYDTSNHKIWAYDNSISTWKGIALT